VVPVGHRLAGSETIDIRDLAFEPFVVTSRRISPYYYDQTLAALAAAGITPRTVIEASSIHAQIGYVACGMGVSLVPSPARAMHSNFVERVPLAQTIVSTEVAVAWAAGPVPQIVQRFLAIVRDEEFDPIVPEYQALVQ
jgi:DNA-binding transcriptional LysR family regulator